MASSLVFVALAAAGAVQAGESADLDAVTPTAPGPGATFNEGSDCTLQYTLDPTGTWKNMTIQLMTGANQAMVPLMDLVTEFDGTTGSGAYSYPCPDVTPNAPIYFYQFTNNGLNPTWTTRFTIADSSGNSVAAPNTQRVNGQNVGWGTGQLVGDATTASSASGSAASGSASSDASGASTDSSSSSSGVVAAATAAASSAAGSASSAASTRRASLSSGSMAAASGSSTPAQTSASSSGSSSSSSSGAAGVAVSQVAGMALCAGAALAALLL